MGGRVGRIFSSIPIPLVGWLVLGRWYGNGTNEAWVNAYELCAVPALLHGLFMMTRLGPVNWVVLGTNIYIVVGGLASLATQQWLLELLGKLQETAFFVVIALVGVVTLIGNLIESIGCNRRSATRRVAR